MKRSVALIAALILVLSLVSCRKEDAVLDESRTYEITSEIHSLDIRINAADLIIRQADRFSVESNLRYLSVSEENGVLTIVDEADKSSTYKEPTLLLCVPTGTVFDRVNIATGAAKLTADTLSAVSVRLDLGAGDVRFGSLNASSDANIKGGAGKITVANGMLSALTLEMGVGESSLTAALIGNCDLNFGMGKSDLTLIGSRDDYSIEAKKGIGSISVDGETVTDFGSSGNGQNHIKISGGVGAIELSFREK